MNKALVVDDCENHRLLLRFELEGKNFTVEEAGSGREGVESALLHQPDIIFLDVNMPCMSGFDVITELQKNFNTRQIPIIVVSAATESGAIEKALDLGAYDFVAKPLDFVVLNARLRSAMRSKQQQEKLESLYSELEKQNDRLEMAVEERTNQLKKSIEKEQTANRAKTLFIANVSHEFRTPLHGILNYIDLAESDIARNNFEDMKEYFDKMSFCANRMSKLIEDLLKITKGEMKARRFESQQVSIEKLLHDVVKVVSASALAGDLIFRLQGEGDFYVLGDQSALTEVFENIVSNAAKFSPNEGEVQIDWEIIHCEGEERVAVYVADRGIGIEEGDLENVFQPFVQGGNRDSGLGGSGLGLAIAKQIVDAHKGRITANSRAGGGCILTVVLPRAVAVDGSCVVEVG